MSLTSVRKLVAACVLSGAASGASHAEEATPLTALDERLDEDVLVSLSGRVTGLVESTAFDGGFASLGTALQVYVDRPAQICMLYRSRNGVYAASQHFSAATPGWTALRFETQYGSDLQAMGEAGLSVRAALSEDCADPQALQLLTPVQARAPAAGETAAHYLLVHADRNPTFLIVSTAAHAQPVSVSCEALSPPGLVAFDTKCSVPAKAFAADAVTVLAVQRADGMHRETVDLVAF